jgi:hypothetical protein
MPDQDKFIITWEAPEFKHYPKNMAWYITLCAIAILVVGYMLIQRDLFGAVSMLIFACFIYFFALQRPQQVQIGMTKTGIHIGEFYIPYKTIRHFWIVHNERHKTVNMETTAYLNRHIVLELEDEDPELIREFLIRVLPEHENTEETFAQKVMHRLKF